MRVHVLTPGFVTPNGRAFLFPLMVHKKALAENNLDVVIKTEADASLTDCDVMLVDSKFHRDRWIHERDGVLEEFATWACEVDRLVYCDTTDSTGTLQSDVLPHVNRYLKSQLLVDRSAYATSHYGSRVYSDYYHANYGVEDERPQYSIPVEDASQLSKLGVSWNSGLADYSFLGVYKMALYHRLPLPFLLSYPYSFIDPAAARGNDVSCRFGVSYARESVAWQRKAIRKMMGDRLATNKLSRREYFAELQNSRVVVSPFGLGEITLKDFEVFLTGGLLFKPDMSHMETWPDLFQSGVTMLSHKWDLSDFEENLTWALEHPKEALQIAQRGQDVYRRHIDRETGEHLFVSRFSMLVENA